MNCKESRRLQKAARAQSDSCEQATTPRKPWGISRRTRKHYLDRALTLTIRPEDVLFRPGNRNDEAALLMRLGQLCERSGRVTEAVAIYRTILARGRIRPSAQRQADGRMRVTLRLGQLYVRLGQRLRAEQLWRDFLGGHPNAASIQQALKASSLRTVSFTIGWK